VELRFKSRGYSMHPIMSQYLHIIGEVTIIRNKIKYVIVSFKISHTSEPVKSEYLYSIKYRSLLI